MIEFPKAPEIDYNKNVQTYVIKEEYETMKWDGTLEGTVKVVKWLHKLGLFYKANITVFVYETFSTGTLGTSFFLVPDIENREGRIQKVKKHLDCQIQPNDIIVYNSKKGLVKMSEREFERFKKGETDAK